MSKIFGFTAEEVQLIKNTVGKDAVNEAELQRFLYRASKLGLNPLDGTIHLQVRDRKNPLTGKYEKANVIIVGIDGIRAVGDGTGKLSGIRRWVEEDENGRIKCGVAQVYRKDWKEPATEVAPFEEFCQKKDGKPIYMWATKPKTMIKKCAEAAAHRMAWSAALAGVYIPEEMDIDSPPDSPANSTESSAETPFKTPPVKPPAETSPVEPPAKVSPVKTPPIEPPVETPSESLGKASEIAEYQVTITSAPTENRGRVVVVGTDILRDDELNLVGIEEGVKNVLATVKPGETIKITGIKKDNGKAFVLVKTITKKKVDEPAQPPEKTNEEPEKPVKPKNPVKPIEQPSENKKKTDSIKVELVVSEEPKEGTYEEDDVFYLTGVDEKGKLHVVFCKASNKANAFPFTCSVKGDVVEITGNILEYKGKEVLFVTDFETLKQAAS